MTTILQSFRALSTIVMLQGLFLCIHFNKFVLLVRDKIEIICYEKQQWSRQNKKTLLQNTSNLTAKKKNPTAK